MAAICNVCGLPDELCICQEIAKEQQKPQSAPTGRYGKIVTKVEGIDDSAIDINQLAKLLKNRCAAGGTVRSSNRTSRRPQEESSSGSFKQRIQCGGAIRWLAQF